MERKRRSDDEMQQISYRRQQSAKLQRWEEEKKQLVGLVQHMETRLHQERSMRKHLEDELREAMQIPGLSLNPDPATLALMHSMLDLLREAAFGFSDFLQPHVEAWEYPYTFANKKHRKFAIAATVCHILFIGFECQDFQLLAGYTLVSDPHKLICQSLKLFQKFEHMEAVQMLQDSSFYKFCMSKWCSFYPKLSAASGVWEAFVKLAKIVWLLHKLAFSFYPNAVPLKFVGGTPLDDQLMEIVIADKMDHLVSEQVGFMLLPGFRIRTQVVKSLVYPKLQRATNL